MKEHWSKLRRFYREDLNHFVFITAGAFVILMVLGFLAGLFVDGVADKAVEGFAQMLENSQIIDDGRINVFRLFLKNLQSVLYTIGMGFIPFILLSAFSLVINSALLGLFAALYVHNGTSLLVYLAGILPHGIFELPAIVLGIACGIYICRIITNYVRFNKKGTVGPAVLNVVRVLVLNIVPLLIVAAIVESYVTPVIMSAVMGM